MLVFVIQAYESKREDGALEDVVTLELIDKNEKSAMAKAKKLVKKKNYRLASIIEKTDG